MRGEKVEKGGKRGGKKLPERPFKERGVIGDAFADCLLQGNDVVSRSIDKRGKKGETEP